MSRAVRVVVSTEAYEDIGADVDMTMDPYLSVVTGYNDPITLSPSTGEDGMLKRIRNGTQSDVVITTSINLLGADNDTITLETGGWIELMCIVQESGDPSEYRVLDHNEKFQLS